MNNTSKSTLCLKEDITMGLFINKQKTLVYKPYFSYGVRLCQNTTENNNFCASHEEIIEMLNYVFVQVYVPESVFDFNNQKNPEKEHMTFKIMDWIINC